METTTTSAPETSTTTQAPRGHILIVDDQPLNVDLTSRYLQQDHYTTQGCSSGYEALEYLEHNTVDAVLLDLMMPDMDGFEACRRIRANRQFAELPILVVTSSSRDADIAQAFAAGANDYINKPLRRIDLTTRLGHALERRRTLQEMRDLSENLDQRVREQTKVLNITLQRLSDEMLERQRSQTQLLEEHRFLSTIMDNTVSGIMSIDSHGILRSFNRAAEHLFGYSAEEAIGQNVSILMPSPHREEHDQYLATYFRTGEKKIIGIGREVTAQHREGRTFPIELAVSEVTVGRQRLFVGIATDISARRSMEAAIQQTRKRLTQQNQALSQLASVVSSAQQNDAAPMVRLAALCRETLQSDSAVILVRPHAEQAWTPYPACASPDASAQHDVLTPPSSALESDLLSSTMTISIKSNRDTHANADVADDNADTWIECGVVVGGQLRGLVRCARSARDSWHLDERHFVSLIASQVALRLESDDRRRAEHQVRAHAARLDNAQHIAKMGDWAWSPRTGEFSASDSLQTMFSPHHARPIESYPELLMLVHPDDRIALSEATDASAIYRRPYSVDFRVITPAGDELFMQGKGEPDPDDAELPCRVACTVIDVTQRKRAELALKDMRDNLQERVNEQTRDLIDARDRALAGERAASAFLANMSHEIRTPLHAVLSYARFGVKETNGELSAKAHAHFEQILQSGNDLLELLNDLLDLSKLRAGRMVYDYGEVALSKVAQVLIDRYALLLREHSVIALIKIQGKERKVKCDEGKISQVLRNLLSNAIKFSPADSAIQICLDFRDEQRVIVFVADKGPGVPEAELASIFDPFVQGSHTKSNAGGTGLGLAICKEVVEIGHRGRIYARNGEAGGAVFTFELPKDVV